MPAWLFLALLLSLVLALAYQLAVRRFGWRVLAYWAVIFGALLAGELLAEYLGWNVTRVGDLRLAPAVASAVLMVGVLWFAGV